MKKLTLALISLFSLSSFAHVNIDKLHNYLLEKYEFSQWESIQYLSKDSYHFTQFKTCNAELCKVIDLIPFNGNNDYQMNVIFEASTGESTKVIYTLDAQDNYNLKNIELIESGSSLKVLSCSESLDLGQASITSLSLLGEARQLCSHN